MYRVTVTAKGDQFNAWLLQKTDDGYWLVECDGVIDFYPTENATIAYKRSKKRPPKYLTFLGIKLRGKVETEADETVC